MLINHDINKVNELGYRIIDVLSVQFNSTRPQISIYVKGIK